MAALRATAAVLQRAAGKVTASRPRRPLRAPIEVTEAAVGRIASLLQKKPDALGIRLGLKTRGCNGLSYTLNYATEKQKLDEVVDVGGIKVYIDNRALLSVIGTTMDWHEDDLRAEFVFNNPNAKGSCGCGESFNV
ncbi:MagR [Symbiodinium sp. KB8]|nr:MagR [Symbiodinium sp. KB8]